jgi:hypothetical protein
MLRGKTLRTAIAGAVCLLSASGASAGWQEKASSFDAGRLAKLDESKAKALQEVESGASSRDRSMIHSVLDAAVSSGGADTLVGSWRCRTIKLGGMTPALIYSWYACRISDRNGVLTFAKLTGSQRTSGTLYPDQSGGLVFLGASSVKGEAVHSYSGSSVAIGAQETPDDQIGLLVATGRNSARLELPYPVQESTLDVIELKR